LLAQPLFFLQPGRLIRQLYPSLSWQIPVKDKRIFLTFDDGPVPEATPFVLALLKQFNARATFFCIGKNVEKHASLFRQVQAEGHRIGNHTYDHLNGWKTKTKTYVENVKKCDAVMTSDLFRPPYGKISHRQIKNIYPEKKIIMWDILSCDFDLKVTPEQCIKNVLAHVRPGSIIVFHDSAKAFPNLSKALPVVLQQLSGAGFIFDVIPPHQPPQ
jgi:peptidoglycan/xylan/chitin deacetylase (PgdA/CDA1 family)